MYRRGVIVIFIFTALLSGCITQQVKTTTTTTTIPLSELNYDDGSFEGAMRFINLGANWSVRFTPNAYPFYLKRVKYYISNAPSPFEVHLYDDDGFGRPGTELMTPFNTTPQGVGWHTVDLSYTIESGDFYVGMRQLNPNESWIGADSSKPIDNRSYFDTGKGWKTLANAGYGFDIGVRVIGKTTVTTTSTTTTITTTTTTIITTTTTTSSTTTTIIFFEEPTLRFTSGVGKCGGVSQANIAVEKDIVTFGGSVRTSSPCHYLTAIFSVYGNDLNVTLEKHSEEKACILCISTIPFSGEITGLISGEYNVKIISEENVVVEGTVYPSVEHVELGVECFTHNDCPPDYYGPYLCVGDRPFRSHYRYACIGRKCVERVSAEKDSLLSCRDIAALISSGFNLIKPSLTTLVRRDNNLTGMFVNSAQGIISDVTFGGECLGEVKGPITDGKTFPVNLTCNPLLIGKHDEFDIVISYTLMVDDGIMERTDSGTLRGLN